MSHPIPFMKASNVAAPKKMAKDAPDLEEAIEEEDDGEVVEPVADDDDDEIDFKKDKYIKQPKAKKATKKAAKADDGDADEAPKGKAKSKAGAVKKGKK